MMTKFFHTVSLYLYQTILSSIIFFTCFFSSVSSANDVSVRLEGHPIYVFNGLPKPEGWGEDLVYQATPSTMDSRTIGAFGGLPLVYIWNTEGGIAVFNTQTFQEPLRIKLKYDAKGVTIKANGGTKLETHSYKGDYYEAVRSFAEIMKKKGMSVQTAPKWAFNANWETYGFEEDFDLNTINKLLPELKKLGIKTITIDSGWYGKNRGEDLETNTGDYKVNPDTIGTEKQWIQFIDKLHQHGFRVRLWWVPGVAEKDSLVWEQHPDWFAKEVISSTGDTEDVYLHPNNPKVKQWNKNLIERFVGYGIDGFKQDDIYHYRSNLPRDKINYANLINSNLSIAQAIKKDFTINSCNCGLAQNFYLIPGQNQLITSDPVGSKQFRHRAKYLHALNLNGAAILADHVELTQGDISPEDMDKAGFYNRVDFTSIVPLGMVLQTKFRKPPGPHYSRWFNIYNNYKFYDMEWVNIPLLADQPEAYLLRDDQQLFFSFFTQDEGDQFKGEINLTHLIPNTQYLVQDLANNSQLDSFMTTRDHYKLAVNFTHSMVLHLSPVKH